LAGAIQCSPALTAFYRALARRLADRDWLEWHFLDFDGTPVAAHLAVRFGRSLTRDLRVYPRRVVPVLVGFIECELPVQVRALIKRMPALALLVSKARTQLRARGVEP
jgi:hypothetical protein